MSTPQDSVRLKEALGILYPIIQAPMAGVSTPELAGAITASGGLGSPAFGACTVERAREQWRRAQSIATEPYNINVFAHAKPTRDAEREKRWLEYLKPLFDELDEALPESLSSPSPSITADTERFELLLEFRPRVVSFHFGLPRPDQLKVLHREGILTMASATSLDEAKRIEEAGIAFCIAQGIEAGGHRGIFDPSINDERLRTEELLERLLPTLSIPIVSAGGLMSGEHIERLLTQGAAAVQLGTAFLLAAESAAPPAYRSRLMSDDVQKTRLLSGISGRPARGLPNRISAHTELKKAPPAPDYPVAYDAAKRLIAAAHAKNIGGFDAAWAGAGTPLLRNLLQKAAPDGSAAPKARDIFATLLQDAHLNVERKACDHLGPSLRVSSARLGNFSP